MKKNPSYTELLYLYEQKRKALLATFSDLKDPQKIYERLIEMGRNLPSPISGLQIEKNLVEGCQSQVFLLAEETPEETICYHIASDALISSGLAALLLAIYNQEPPELTLLCPPLFVAEMGLTKALSPSRSNGLASIYSRMKQEALKLLSNKK